ncbi:ATP-binding protein [Fulvivirga kasyanovii]|uniref:histidine kinase n=1 Tax=Fulvivirga kasyanovii TaxID=396812 RepID=A0ABW9RLA1_9BACT|nr:sensor histidine kinase [Fulvivirga kasyanovii]MTI24872.1 histidine kinase [Fulvivirga kasyanovii]
MEIKWLVIILSFIYLVLLFLIAAWAEKNAEKRWLKSPYIYALSLAVYCTAWTFYGSVGRASNQGLDFLTTYVGPILLAPVFWIILRKVIRISKIHRITNLADFITSRYGKRASLGAFVTIFCLLGVLPYISIQIKAISNSFAILANEQMAHSTSLWFFEDTAFYITIALAVFTIIFGVRNIDANQKNIGLITTIAFESTFKLVAFLAVGIFVTYGIFDGFEDVFTAAASLPDYERLTVINKNEYGDWMWLNMLSALAFLFLPRQFHVAVKENRDESHLRKTMWLFPLYLLFINVFVLPIALGGKMIFAGQSIDADTYVLAIPLAYDQHFLAIIIYLGGFSAATSMIIVSTSALSIMISNHIITPTIIKSRRLSKPFEGKLNLVVLRGRQSMILLMLLLAYLYFKYVGEQFSLVSIGLISFVAVAQFTPAILGGIFWKAGNGKGAFSGLIVGFIIWFYTLVIPTVANTGVIPPDFVVKGIFGFQWLSPQDFLGLSSMSYIVRGLFWSLMFNLFTYLIVSVTTKRSSQEINQAEIFVDIFKYSSSYESSVVWKGKAFLADIKNLLAQFLGIERTERAFKRFMYRNDINEELLEADYRTVNYAENLLSGVVGSTSARVLISSVVKEEKAVDISEVFSILRESQQYISDNKELTIKSRQLQEATEKLKEANEKLRQLDQLKDEFISTVTHEMRTPITSIRALSEILHDNNDLDQEERSQFLSIIVEETERMERLINQVLDLEKMESGQLELPLSTLQLNDVVRESLNSIEQLILGRKIILKTELQPELPAIKGNKDRLIQVILNLVSNAIKFCDQEAGEITILTNEDSGLVELTVMDNGSGVPEESKELIFQAFYQDKNQTLKKQEGSGLGLTICQKIIEKHGGKIWVKNNGSNGAVFTFSIPGIMQLNEESINSG